MPISRRRLIALLPLLMLLTGFRQAPLVDPDPIDVPANMTLKNVGKAVEISLIRRGWTVANKTDAGVDAVLHLREHTASIHVAYDTRQVRIRYVSSTNLKYEESDGKRLIHKNYLGWIQNLVTDIRANLVLLS
jgi:hypothetical protein